MGLCRRSSLTRMDAQLLAIIPGGDTDLMKAPIGVVGEVLHYARLVGKGHDQHLIPRARQHPLSELCRRPAARKRNKDPLTRFCQPTNAKASPFRCENQP